MLSVNQPLVQQPHQDKSEVMLSTLLAHDVQSCNFGVVQLIAALPEYSSRDQTANRAEA